MVLHKAGKILKKSGRVFLKLIVEIYTVLKGKIDLQYRET